MGVTMQQGADSRKGPPEDEIACRNLAALTGRSLLTLDDLSDEEMAGLLELAAALKAKKRSGVKGNLLERKNIAMIFEKLSTRTRCAAMVAAADEGGCAECLAAGEIHLGVKESVADTARVLGRMFHGILFRGHEHSRLEELARHAGVPVWNGLTDDAHPTQGLADLLTIRERFGRLRGLKVVYVGDGRNNVANSLMLGCAKVGADCVNCTPPELSPPDDVLLPARAVAARNGSSLSVEHDPAAAVRGAHVVYTDVWTSMGEESVFEERIELLRPYQVNMALMGKTDRLGEDGVVFLHCLPAYHNDGTDLSRKTGALEVTDDVFHAAFSLVFDQAENRVHTMKAIFASSLQA
jgi:ornithine carbamoyltransferase